MTLKKGIQILEFFLGEKTKSLQGMQKLENSFHNSEILGLAQQLRKNLETDVKVLEMIRGQIVPKCRHSKKFQDRTKNGVLYCTNCNMDL